MLLLVYGTQWQSALKVGKPSQQILKGLPVVVWWLFFLGKNRGIVRRARVSLLRRIEFSARMNLVGDDALLN